MNIKKDLCNLIERKMETCDADRIAHYTAALYYLNVDETYAEQQQSERTKHHLEQAKDEDVMSSFFSLAKKSETVCDSSNS